MTLAEVLAFARGHRYAVQASVAASEVPQAAVVGFVATDSFELFFDTLDTTRKAANLRSNASIAFVIGGTLDGDERTVQYEGSADEPQGEELARLKELYFARFPDGREREQDPDIMYVRVKPSWIRYSDFNQVPPQIVEFGRDEIDRNGVGQGWQSDFASRLHLASLTRPRVRRASAAARRR